MINEQDVKIGNYIFVADHQNKMQKFLIIGKDHEKLFVVIIKDKFIFVDLEYEDSGGFITQDLCKIYNISSKYLKERYWNIRYDTSDLYKLVCEKCFKIC